MIKYIYTASPIVHLPTPCLWCPITVIKKLNILINVVQKSTHTDTTWLFCKETSDRNKSAPVYLKMWPSGFKVGVILLWIEVRILVWWQWTKDVGRNLTGNITRTRVTQHYYNVTQLQITHLLSKLSCRLFYLLSQRPSHLSLINPQLLIFSYFSARWS